MSPPVPAGCYCPAFDLPPTVDWKALAIKLAIATTRVV